MRNYFIIFLFLAIITKAQYRDELNSMVDVKKAIEKLTEKIDKASEAPIIEKAKNWDSTLKWIFGIVAGIIVGVAGAILTGK